MKTLPDRDGQKAGTEAEAARRPISGRKREGLLRIALIAGTIAFCWALFEIPAVFDIVDYEGLGFQQVWASVRFIRVPDPKLLHIEPPYAHYAGSSRGGDFETHFQVSPAQQTLFHWNLKYDRNGFRNPTDLTHADIAVLGDSMVEGMTVSDEELSSSILERLEGQSVANLGQYGYGPQQELVVLERFALQLKPRLIVWMFFEGNDLKDEIAYQKYVDHPAGRLTFWWNSFIERSFTRFAARTVLGLFARQKPPGVVRSGEFAGGNVYFSTAAARLSPEELGAVDATAHIVGSAHERGAAQGARLVFVFIPDKFRVLRDYCHFPEKSECRNWELSDLPVRMRNALHSASPDIGFVDLTPDMRELAKSGVLPYYTDDMHFAPEGHKAAAMAIHKFLEADRAQSSQ